MKGIVDKLGGRIEVKSSTAGQTGTCFSIFLPATVREKPHELEEVDHKSSRRSHMG